MAVKVFVKDKVQDDVYLALDERSDKVVLRVVDKEGVFIKNLLEITRAGIRQCLAAGDAGIATENGKVAIYE